MTGCGPAAAAPDFDQLMAEVLRGASRFGHREHLHLTWLAVRHFGPVRAVDVISDGIQRTARYQGAPQKYNATVSRAWVELIAHHVAERPENDFSRFVSHHTALLDKRLLLRFYRSTTLAGHQAREGWVEPDAHAFPWA
jgi:hypothetical protein